MGRSGGGGNSIKKIEFSSHFDSVKTPGRRISFSSNTQRRSFFSKNQLHLRAHTNVKERSKMKSDGWLYEEWTSLLWSGEQKHPIILHIDINNKISSEKESTTTAARSRIYFHLTSRHLSSRFSQKNKIERSKK